MLIVNQDRDLVVAKTQPLYTAPVIVSGSLWGFNLFHGGTMLGTFDSLEEAIAEMNAIEACTDEIYFVNGYCNGEEDEELWALLLREVEYELAD